MNTIESRKDENRTVEGRTNQRVDPFLLGMMGITFIIHLALINWNRAEYTDGILQLTLFENQNTYMPPLYTALTYIPRLLGLDALYSGRLISILVSSLVLLPIYQLGLRLFDIRIARYAILVYAVMAVPNRWSIRVMTDPTFTLFFAWSVLAFLEALDKPERIWSLPQMLLMAGLASLTRYQGLIFLPLILCVAVQSMRALRDRREYTGRFALMMILGMLPWLVFGYWMSYRGMTHGTQFGERMGSSFLETFLRYLDMAQTFVLFFPYALTYPFFLAALYGLVKSDTGHHSQRHLLWTLLYLFPVWLIVHSAFQSFQYRYFLPFMPFFALYAARGLFELEQVLWKHCPHPAELNRPPLLSRARIITGASLLFSLVFSSLVITLQRNAFADVSDVARYIRVNLKDARVYSDEFYGPLQRPLPNPITEFYTERKMEFLYDEYLRFRQDVKPGDYIVWHNIRNNPDNLQHALARRFKVEVIYRCRYTLVPLLPDIMVSHPVTSQPRCMAYRFELQVYEAGIYRLK